MPVKLPTAVSASSQAASPTADALQYSHKAHGHKKNVLVHQYVVALPAMVGSGVVSAGSDTASLARDPNCINLNWFNLTWDDTSRDSWDRGDYYD